MVEFNLLPDIKIQYLRTKRMQYLVVTLSFIVGGIALAIFILMFLFVDVAQKVRLDNLNTQITTDTQKLESTSNLNQILTVQSQLESIPNLENQSPTVSRLFGYVSQATPLTATISTINVDFTTDSIVVTGAADSLATVNTYVDTLEYSTYDNATAHTKNNPAFKSVVLSSFGYSDSTNTQDNANYTVTFSFDPTLFDSADNVTLVVPSEITTRSIINQPALFKKADPTSTTQ